MHEHLDGIPLGGRAGQGEVIFLALILGREPRAVHRKLYDLRVERREIRQDRTIGGGAGHVVPTPMVRMSGKRGDIMSPLFRGYSGFVFNA